MFNIAYFIRDNTNIKNGENNDMIKLKTPLVTSAIVAMLTGTLVTAGVANASSHGSGGMKKEYGQGMGEGKGMGHGMKHHSNGVGGKNAQRKFMQRFAIIDENSDDRIGADEAAAWRESVFFAMDADDDSELTNEEYMTIRMGNGEGHNAKRQKRKQEKKQARFKPMDTDNSGTVSITEWMDAGKKSFAKADADGDGIVTPWEFRANRKNR